MQNLIILGAGESGVGAALLGKKEAFNVWVSDYGTIHEVYKKELDENNIPYEEGQHTEEKILQADLVIKSPGIPKTAPILQLLEKKKIPVISEIEWASRHTKAKIIALTGSNGKTTTTSLIHSILEREGLNVALGGNIGISFARLVAANNHDFYVLEISSFQLDDIQTFRPYIGIILNISIDHLDQYENKFDLYAQSKFKITENQTQEDFLVYNLDNEPIVNLLQSIGTDAEPVPFSIEQTVEKGAYLKDGQIQVNHTSSFSMNTNQLSLLGKHNLSNSMAAATVANILKIGDANLREILSGFKTMEHRLESLGKVAGVQYINDSKATNVNATYYALDSMEKDIVWIVGGTDKGNNYEEIMDLVKKKVKAIICLGTNNQKLVTAFAEITPKLVETDNMQEALKHAYQIAKKGDVVLLSPACASFDLFKNYEDRGQQFKEAVKQL